MELNGARLPLITVTVVATGRVRLFGKDLQSRDPFTGSLCPFSANLLVFGFVPGDPTESVKMID